MVYGDARNDWSGPTRRRYSSLSNLSDALVLLDGAAYVGSSAVAARTSPSTGGVRCGFKCICVNAAWSGFPGLRGDCAISGARLAEVTYRPVSDPMRALHDVTEGLGFLCEGEGGLLGSGCGRIDEGGQCPTAVDVNRAQRHCIGLLLLACTWRAK